MFYSVPFIVLACAQSIWSLWSWFGRKNKSVAAMGLIGASIIIFSFHIKHWPYVREDTRTILEKIERLPNDSRVIIHRGLEPAITFYKPVLKENKINWQYSNPNWSYWNSIIKPTDHYQETQKIYLAFGLMSKFFGLSPKHDWSIGDRTRIIKAFKQEGWHIELIWSEADTWLYKISKTKA
jgi:hypothetical protein